MRFIYLGTALLIATLPVFCQTADPHDSVTLSGNTVQSPYFKFRYSFPQGWTTRKDDLRMEKNRTRHQEAVQRVETEQSRVVNAAGTYTKTVVFWMYDLLWAGPTIADEGKVMLPYVRVWVMECSNVTNKPGDYAKLIERPGFAKQLGKPESVKIAGRKFMRSNLLLEGEHVAQKQYETVFETLSGKYLLIFELHAKTQPETDELAKTMESVSFTK